MTPQGAGGGLTPDRTSGDAGVRRGAPCSSASRVFGDPPPHVVLTGGDPLERSDLFELIAYARSLGLGVSVSPSATPRLTPEVVQRLRDAGVEERQGEVGEVEEHDPRLTQAEEPRF